MIFCPISELSCPYYQIGDVCGMPAMEGCDPRVECDAFDGLEEEEEEEE